MTRDNRNVEGEVSNRQFLLQVYPHKMNDSAVLYSGSTTAGPNPSFPPFLSFPLDAVWSHTLNRNITVPIETQAEEWKATGEKEKRYAIVWCCVGWCCAWCLALFTKTIPDIEVESVISIVVVSVGLDAEWNHSCKVANHPYVEVGRIEWSWNVITSQCWWHSHSLAHFGRHTRPSKNFFCQWYSDGGTCGGMSPPPKLGSSTDCSRMKSTLRAWHDQHTGSACSNYIYSACAAAVSMLPTNSCKSTLGHKCATSWNALTPVCVMFVSMLPGRLNG